MGTVGRGIFGLRIMRVRAKTLLRGWLLAGVLGCSTSVVVAQPASGGSGKNFKLPEYDAQGRIKSQVAGKSVKQLPNNQMLITTLYLETFRDDGKVELIVEAPECLYDTQRRTASSAGKMKARQADGKFTITGEGFEWRQTNSVLIISNLAHTIISKELLKPQSPPPTPATVPGQDLEVFADHFDYNSKTGVAVYRGHVRASDPQMKLGCDVLTVKTAASGNGVESIVARQNVVIEQGGTRATGDQAVYTITATEETIKVTGNAAWHSPGHEGKGDALILDRKRNEFKSKGKAYAKLFPAAMKAPGAPTAATEPRIPTLATNNVPVEVFAEILTVQLPPADGPVQHLVAEQEVVILQGDSRATGSRAVYSASATAAAVELTGDPTFRTSRFEGKGETLQWNRESGEFHVRRNGYLKMAREGAGPSPTNRVVEIFSDDYDFKPGAADFRGHVRLNDPEWKLAAETVAMTLSTPGNQIQSIDARRNVTVEQIENRAAGNKNPPWRLTAEEVTAKMTPTGNQIENIVARRNVLVEQLESREAAGRSPPWKLTSEDVTVKLSAPGNRINDIKARQNVVVTQSAAREAGDKTTPWTLTGDAVNVRLSASGNEIENIVAEKNVVVDRLESRTDGKQTAPWKLLCDLATVRLSPKDHQVADIVAERNVIIRQGDSRATGTKAVFTGTNNIVELTGNPVLQLLPTVASAETKVPRRLMVTGADVLLWDRANNKFKARGDYTVTEPKAEVPPPK